jgi:predicted metal-dependent hydrolase
MILKDIFYEGAHLFNACKYNDAHITWEGVWKNGSELERPEIKGFIQLTGAILNTKSGKISSGKYLFNKSLSNISASVLIPEWVEFKPLLGEIMACLEHLDEKPYELLPRIEIIFQ